MNKFILKHFEKITTLAEPIADFITFFSSFVIGYYLYCLVPHPPVEWSGSYLRFAWVASILGIVIFHLKGLYKRQNSLMNIIEIRQIIQANLILALILFALFFVLRLNHPVIAVSFSVAVALVMTITERMLFFKLGQSFNLQGSEARKVIILGAGEIGCHLYKNIFNNPKLGYKVIGFFDEDDELSATIRKLHHSANNGNGLFFWQTTDELKNAIRQHNIEEVLIARPAMTPDRIHKLIYDFKEMKVEFSYIPYMFGHFVEHLQIKDIGGIPMFFFEKIPESKAEQVSKKFLDFLAGVISLIILSPLFLVLTVLVKLDSAGPVFFRQVRVGKDGEKFTLYKFRTMEVDSPKYAVTPSHADDPRITKIGKFLRRTSLDEIPQLFNVIYGEMSLVGPRPEMPFIVEKYNEIQRERLRVKPGITGVWQISADRTRPIHENISYDLFYIQNRSLLLDLVIILRTVIYLIFYAKTY